jgi:hypothetical protein
MKSENSPNIQTSHSKTHQKGSESNPRIDSREMQTLPSKIKTSYESSSTPTSINSLEKMGALLDVGYQLDSSYLNRCGKNLHLCNGHLPNKLEKYSINNTHLSSNLHLDSGLVQSASKTSLLRHVFILLVVTMFAILIVEELLLFVH